MAHTALPPAIAGDANNSASTSSAVAQSVSRATTSTVLTINPNPSSIGQTATFTATVTGGVSPTGTVVFYYAANGTSLGSATLSNGTASISLPSSYAGSNSIGARYTGDVNNVDSTAAAVTQVINKATSTTALTSNYNPAAPNQQPVTLRATVTGYGYLSGPVVFYDGTTQLGWTYPSAGVATLNYTFSLGAHNLSALYVGDANNLSSTSPTYVQTVAQVATTTTLASSANPSTAGQAVTLTASVAGSSPSGYVTFKDGTTTLGTGTLTAGTATLSYTFTAIGAHSLTAVYSGDTSNATSTSAAVAQTVSGATTSTTLTSNHNPASVGQAVTLTAAVTGASPTGAVTFMDGTTTLGTGTISAGTATFSYTFTTPGAHSLTASYPGDANNAASTSAALAQTVNLATSTTTLTSSLNPSVIGQPVTLTATVTGATPTGTVTFMDGATTLGTGTISAGTATFSYTFATPGAHSLTASYPGDAGNTASTSTAVAQTVNKATSATTLTSSLSPSTVGQPITLTATVAGSAPTGTVTFMDGTTTLGTGTISAGTATLSYTFTTSGSRTLSASYAGDANNTASTSLGIPQTVNGANSTLTLTSSPASPVVGQPVTFSVVAHGYNPTGTITFYDGGTVLGYAALDATGAAGFTYTFPWPETITLRRAMQAMPTTAPAALPSC